MTMESMPAGCTSECRPPAPISGPGFDALGLALDLHDDVVARANDERGVRIEIAGEGARHRSEGRVAPRGPGHAGRRSNGSSANPRVSPCSASTGSRTAAVWIVLGGHRRWRSARPHDRCRRSSGAAGRQRVAASGRPRGAPRQRRTVPAGWPVRCLVRQRRDSRAAGANRAGDPTGRAGAADADPRPAWRAVFCRARCRTQTRRARPPEPRC